MDEVLVTDKRVGKDCNFELRYSCPLYELDGMVACTGCDINEASKKYADTNRCK